MYFHPVSSPRVSSRCQNLVSFLHRICETGSRFCFLGILHFDWFMSFDGERLLPGFSERHLGTGHFPQTTGFSTLTTHPFVIILGLLFRWTGNEKWRL